VEPLDDCSFVGNCYFLYKTCCCRKILLLAHISLYTEYFYRLYATTGLNIQSLFNITLSWADFRSLRKLGPNLALYLDPWDPLGGNEQAALASATKALLNQIIGVLVKVQVSITRAIELSRTLQLVSTATPSHRSLCLRFHKKMYWHEEFPAKLLLYAILTKKLGTDCYRFGIYTLGARHAALDPRQLSLRIRRTNV
jgi:hypothetical protein